MTPEIRRILSQLSPAERAMYTRAGGRIPPGTPPAQAQWRKVDVYPWVSEREVKKTKVAA
jgi:hypothetical protein